LSASTSYSSNPPRKQPHPFAKGTVFTILRPQPQAQSSDGQHQRLRRHNIEFSCRPESADPATVLRTAFPSQQAASRRTTATICYACANLGIAKVSLDSILFCVCLISYSIFSWLNSLSIVRPLTSENIDAGFGKCLFQQVGSLDWPQAEAVFLPLSEN
jgi:hypothetical protein